MTGVIVVGGGQAAGQLAAGLRQQGYTAPIRIFSDEAYPPYQRPPLSKQFLSGEWALDRLFLRPNNFYLQKEVKLHTGVTVASIDRAKKTITTTSSETHEYSDLVIATGSRARRLTIPGSDLSNVFYLRTADDVNAIRGAFLPGPGLPGRKLVIVGGGYIGLEVAAVAIKTGLTVTVLEMESRILQRVTTQAMSDFYHRIHSEHGVDIRVSTRVSEFRGNGTVQSIACADGTTIDADLVVVGVGVLPNVEIADASGLAIDNGIVVDSSCRTADAHVYAIGDCARGFNEILGRSIRLESVPNAMEQARVVAANICGKQSTYDTMPWFWSDQYDLKLQMVGFAADGEQAVVRGDPAANAFMTFYLTGGRVVAADAVNQARDFLITRQLCERRTPVDGAFLADVHTDLKQLLSQDGLGRPG